MSVIFIKVKYDIKKNHAEVETNAKSEVVPDLIWTYIGDQIGRGKDERKAAELDVYELELQLDLTHDTFRMKSNTNNDGLSIGILAQTAKQLEKELKDDEKRSNCRHPAEGCGGSEN